MNKSWVYILVSILLSACTRYDVRPVKTEWTPGLQGKWGVYRNGYLIPEFTATQAQDFADSENQAKQLLEARRHSVEKVIFLKYEKPRRTFAHVSFFTIAVIEGPFHDLFFFMPVEAAEKLFHPRTSRFIWFPTTRFAAYELMYGPTYDWARDFTAVPPLRDDWADNRTAQKEFSDAFQSVSLARK